MADSSFLSPDGSSRSDSSVSIPTNVERDSGGSVTSNRLYGGLKDAFEAAGLPSSLADDAAKKLLAGNSFTSIPAALASNQFSTILSYYGGGLNNLPGTFNTDDGQMWGINHNTGEVTALTGNAGASFFVGGENIFSDDATGIVPTLTQDEIGLATGISMPKTGGGRRGGGGGGAAGPTFDLSQLSRTATEIWRGLLLEEPQNARGMAESYAAAARAAARQGKPLDFETYIYDQAKQTGRYNTLYGRKPETMNEREWIGQYVTAVRQMGLRESKTNELVTAGAQSGPGAAGFQEGLKRRSDVIAGNRGTFSDRFAAQMAQVAGT